MDFAYDHIQEHTYSSDRSTTPKPSDPSNSASASAEQTDPGTPRPAARQNLQTEFQETFKAFSASPWGAKLGGWWSSARTQGATYYETAVREAEKREAEAARAFEEARKVVVERTKTVVEAAEEQLDSIVNEERREQQQQQQRSSEEGEEEKKRETTTTTDTDTETQTSQSQLEQEEDTETFLNRFKAEAAKRLKEVQAAEDAADEALLRFGTNVRNFLRDTISITAPDSSAAENVKSSEVLFESKDATTGKRVIHASRFDAQLHVIHTTLASFAKDPDGSGDEWEDFKKGFNVEEKTDDIAKDLNTYPELRNAMEKLMSEEVEYKDFWTRYYFLRHVVEMQEEKRKDMLKASAAVDDEEVGWDEDSDEDEAGEGETKTTSKTSTPQQKEQKQESTTTTNTTESTKPTTPQRSPAQGHGHARTDSDAMTLRAPRRSHDEKSVADSEASYDLVSGAASHANSSPKEKPVREESDDDEDDWE